MERIDVFMQLLIYFLTALVIVFIVIKSYGTICFSFFDNILSVVLLFLSLVLNIYLTFKYRI